ncbi:MAG: hypothetical protein NC420_10775 [Eubacterium sp.]|nr:hypothetical protein [Eubacterium sp.]MCM1213121.1 hypothetical protein [Lachnospiraceae bacterium]MCM1239426.1 hypothetical protein [Lachnospiraceae bacterium]
MWAILIRKRTKAVEALEEADRLSPVPEDIAVELEVGSLAKTVISREYPLEISAAQSSRVAEKHDH